MAEQLGIRSLNYLSKPIIKKVEQMSLHHSGVLSIALKLISFAGDMLNEGECSYIDFTLAHAASAWDGKVDYYGIDEAYKAYCLTILTSLPTVLTFDVRGYQSAYAKIGFQWDPIEHNYLDWLREKRIIRESIKIQPIKINTAQYHMAQFVFAARIFNRLDLIKLQYLPDDINLTAECHQ
tara:strand:+ start:19711 stop:20250 length:540 start_codon:yes stop_codon:yes gene_type:complete